MNRADKFNQLAGGEVVNRNLKEKSVRGALFMGIWNGFDFILRMATSVILARILVPEDFGLVAMVYAVTGMIDGVRDLGLSTATVQRHGITHEQVSNLFWINVSAGILFFLFFSVASYGIANFYNEPKLIAITVAISTTFIMSGLTVQHEALLSRQIKQGQIMVIRLSADLASMLLAIMFAVGGYEYWALVFREIIRSLLIVSGFWICCPWLPGLPSKNAGIRELLRFGRDISATHLLIGMISRVDGLIVGKYFGANSVGLYRQAYNLMMVPIDQLNGPILSVAQPGLSRLQSEPERYRRYYQKILFFITAATIPIGIITAVFSKEITILLLGEKWINASDFLRIFAVAAALRPAIGTSAIVLITCGKSTRYLLLAAAHSVALLIFMLAGIKWGAVGVACAHVGTTVVLMVPKLYYSFLGTPISFRVFFQTTRSPTIAGIIMASFLMACLSFKLLSEVGLSYIIFSGVGLIIYIAILFLRGDSREYIIVFYRDIAFSLWKKQHLNVKASASSI